jgi:hypothetical protein
MVIHEPKTVDCAGFAPTMIRLPPRSGSWEARINWIVSLALTFLIWGRCRNKSRARRILVAYSKAQLLSGAIRPLAWKRNFIYLSRKFIGNRLRLGSRQLMNERRSILVSTHKLHKYRRYVRMYLYVLRESKVPSR